MIVDAFAGPGGWDQGARLAGYAGPLLGVELDMDACRTAVAAGHPRVRADVATFPLTRMAGRVDGLIQSPPCPTWSAAGDGAGKVDLPNVLRLIADFAAGREPSDYHWADARSALTAQPMRWAHALRPRWVALEQVPPVLPIWEYIADRLRGLGYRVWTGILAAEEFGVPQTRRRAVLISRLDGPALPPVPSHQAYRSGRDVLVEPDLFGDPLPPPVSMATALGWGVERPSWTVSGSHDPFVNADARERLRDAVAVRNANLAWVLRSNYGTGGDAQDRGERAPDEPAFTVTGKIKGAQWRMHPAGLTGSYGYSRPIGEPSPTIKGAGSGGQYVSDGETSTRVTVEEAGILQSFPADYPWSGTSTKRYLQVGNAIPTLLAAAILRPLLAADACEVAA